MIEQYKTKRNPVSVSFRELVPWLHGGQRATHYIHSYPAKLLPQIAHFFLAASTLSKSGDIVLDPFCGTGTVALETILAGRRAWYADVNPLARLVTKVKTTRVDIIAADEALNRVHQAFKRTRRCNPPDVVNITLWYDENTIRDLSRLRKAIDAEPTSEIKDFLWVTFSTVARKASLADPRLSVPVRRKQPTQKTKGLASGSKVQVWSLFSEQYFINRERQRALALIGDSLPVTECVGSDARKLTISKDRGAVSTETRVPDESVELIITSPPYAGAQKYIRASSLNLGWLGLAASTDLKLLERRSIGREHFPKAEADQLGETGVPEADRIIQRVFQKNRTRAAILSAYLNEMRQAVSEMVRVLRPGGHIVLVIGNNEVCGEVFESSEYIASLFRQAGLTLSLQLIDAIKSRGLMTKRNRAASIITREWVLLFKKDL